MNYMFTSASSFDQLLCWNISNYTYKYDMFIDSPGKIVKNYLDCLPNSPSSTPSLNPSLNPSLSMYPSSTPSLSPTSCLSRTPTSFSNIPFQIVAGISNNQNTLCLHPNKL